MESVLVTGGAGFIGSHTCVSLLNEGYKIYIVDSLINSSKNVIPAIKKIFKNKDFDVSENLSFFEGDIRKINDLELIFLTAKNDGNPITSVIHFAGLKSVKESSLEPLKYWDTNVNGSINLLRVMDKYDCLTIVFSSSATIYGLSEKHFINEDSELLPINPYGRTKVAVEKFLDNVFTNHSKKWKIASLRYFNPIGAHSSGLIGEDPKGIPNNIFPFINQVACANEVKLSIFGNDWPTKDGTGIRDYIHVMDLAEGHVKTLNYLSNFESHNISLNIGNAKGTSVLELVDVFEKVNNVKIPYIIKSRREGDVARLVADNSLLKRTLNWVPSRSIEDMCIDGWKWKNLNPNGFQD